MRHRIDQPGMFSAVLKLKTQEQDLSKNAYAEKLTLLDPLREPLFRSLIHSLKLTEGSRGLDIGCEICAGGCRKSDQTFCRACETRRERVCHCQEVSESY